MIDMMKWEALTAQLENAEDCRRANAFISSRFAYIQRMKKLDFVVGDRVRFEHKGTTYDGNVTKINRKTLSLKLGSVTWRVSPSVLEKV